MATVLLLLLAGALPAAGQDLEPDGDFNKGGRTSLQFLKIGMGARQTALGEASIAAVRDVNAIYWNPAGIAGVEQFETSFSYVRWLAGMNYAGGAVRARWRRVGIFALSVAALDYGDIQEALVTAPGGGNDTRTGNTFTGSDLLASAAYAREFTDRLSIGVSAKFIREELFEYAVSTVAFDVGTNYDVGFNGVRLAMSAQNFGGSVDYLGDVGSRPDEGFDIPLVFRIGATADLIDGADEGGDAFFALGPAHRVTVAAEAVNTNDFSERLHLGLEYGFTDLLALRGGYRLGYAEGNLALGFGLNVDAGDVGLRLDYSYVGYEFLEAPHRFSFSVAF